MIRCAAFALIAVGLTVPAQAEEPGPITPAEPKLDRPVDFDKDIRPILAAKCLACHNATDAESDLVLEDPAGIGRGGASGAAVVAGKPEESLLYQVAARTSEPVMPPADNDANAKPLTPQELGLLKQWIAEGAKAGSGSSGSVNWQGVPSIVNAVYSLSLSPDARWLAAGRANRIELYDLAAGSKVAELTDPQLATIAIDGQPLYPNGAAHRDLVHAVAFSPDGRRIASGGYRTIKLWERAAWQPLKQIGLGADLVATAVSGDGKQLATSHADHSVRIWNVEQGQATATLTGHGGPVKAIAFNRDGSVAFTASDDNTIRSWNVADGKLVASVTIPAAATALAAAAEPNHVVAAHADNALRLWNVASQPAEADGNEAAPAAESPQPVREFKGHSQPVVALRVTADGKTLVSGGSDATVRIWNLESGGATRTMNHGGPVTAIDVRDDGSRIASVSSNGIARLWDATNGKQLAEMKGDIDAARLVQSRTDEQTVAKARIGLADAAQKAAEKEIETRTESLNKAKEAVTAAEKAVAEAQKKADEAQQKAEAAAKASADKPDDKGLEKSKTDAEAAAKTEADALQKAKDALASAQRGVKLSEEVLAKTQQNLEQRKQAHETAKTRGQQADEQLKQAQEASAGGGGALTAVAFLPGGDRVATTGEAGIVRLYSSADGRALEQFAAGMGVRSLSTAGEQVVSVTADHTAKLWPAHSTWSLSATLGPPANAHLSIGDSVIEDRVLALAFSPDGSKLASGGGEPSRSGELLLWDVQNKSLIREINDAHSDTVTDVEFSFDGDRIVSGAADKFVKVHDVATGEHVRSYEGHTAHVLGVSWKADGSMLASAGADNVIKVWDTETGEQRRTISGFSKEVTDVDYLGVSDNTVSGAGDANVRLHQASNGRNYRNFGGMSDFVFAVEAARDESTVAAAGQDGTIRVWNGQNGQLLHTFAPPPTEQQTAATP